MTSSSETLSLLHIRFAYVGVKLTCLNHEIPKIKSPLTFTINEATPDDLKKINSSLSGTEYPGGIALAIRDGSKVYVAKNTDDMLGFTLINYDFITITDGVIFETLDPNEIYSHYSYVFPKYRGKKVFQKIKQVIYQMEFAKGTQKIISIVETNNLPSINAQKHLDVTKEEFVWIVDSKKLKEANTQRKKTMQIPAKTIYENQPYFILTAQLGKLDRTYHQIKQKIKKKIKNK